MRLVASGTFLFTERPLLERPAAAAAAGFDAVEFWWPFRTPEPTPSERDAFVGAVERAGVALTGLNVHSGDGAAGERGLLSLPGREDEFRRGVDAAVELAGRLGVAGLTCLYGNRLEPFPAEEQDALAIENLRYAASGAASVGARLLLEPVSGAPAYPLRTADDVVAIIERFEAAGGAGAWLLADLFHLTVNGDDVARAIDRHAARVGHVQIADSPGRHEPGTGTIPLGDHLRALAAAGYDGRVALEYVPSTETEGSLGWASALLSARDGAGA